MFNENRLPTKLPTYHKAKHTKTDETDGAIVLFVVEFLYIKEVYFVAEPSLYIRLWVVAGSYVETTLVCRPIYMSLCQLVSTLIDQILV